MLATYDLWGKRKVLYCKPILKSGDVMEKRHIIVEETESGNLLAQGVPREDVQLFEGAWYFDKTAVNLSNLIITDRIYICSYKGSCYWIDLQTENGRVADVAFTYFTVNLGYEFVQDKIGFYAGKRDATHQYDKKIGTTS